MTKIEIVEAAKVAVVTFSNGVSVVNTTPHNLTFLDGESVVDVPTSGIIISGKAVEENTGLIEHMKEAGYTSDQLTIVKTEFVANADGHEFIKLMDEILGDKVLYIGSIIAAQAYPGTILAMTPAPGFERVAPAEKRMSTSKFTTF